MPANDVARRRRGFTLIELLIALTILTIILGIIYAAFASVVDSIEDTRAASEELRTRQFIRRNLDRNLGQASEGWSPGAAYRAYAPAAITSGVPGETAGHGIMRYPFLGAHETTRNGPADTVSFVSSAPMIGAAAIPGAMKLCTYTLEEEVAEDRDFEPRSLLKITESRWIAPGLGDEQTFAGPAQAADLVAKAGERAGLKPVAVSVPVYAWELAYYDGKEWRPTWDGQQVGRLPWAVRVRIKVRSAPGDPFANSLELDPENDPDVVELMFTVPVGTGVLDSPPDYARPSDREAAT